MEKFHTQYKMGTIQFKNTGEGEFFNKWMYRRLIAENKNVITAELGSTGSGKSYRDLRKAELWYKYHFKEEFPSEHICFGVEQVMKLLAEGNLKKGSVIIFEEAGVNLGSRDWQNKMSKMFNYILQSFRSMNLALFLNLPYLSMLDVQARNLLHYYAESVGIRQDTKQNECKPFFVQIAQGTGKVYRKYPKVIMGGKKVKLKRFLWSMPSKNLVDAYEEKKLNYLKQLTKEYHTKISGEGESVKVETPSRQAIEVYVAYQKKPNYSKLSEIFKLHRKTITKYVKMVEDYQKETNKGGVAKEIEVLAT